MNKLKKLKKFQKFNIFFKNLVPVLMAAYHMYYIFNFCKISVKTFCLK